VDVLVKVVAVLKWAEIETSTPESVRRAIGFAWFCHTLWACLQLLPVTPRYCIELSEGLNKMLERATGFQEGTIDELVDGLIGKGVESAADLLNLPELTYVTALPIPLKASIH